MNFLAVIITFVISNSLSGRINFVAEWAGHWQALLGKYSAISRFRVALYLLLPALSLALLLFWANNLIVTFVVSLIILLLAFQSSDQPESLAEYQEKVADGDDQGAWQLAVAELGLERQLYEPGDEAIDQGVQAGLVYMAFERFFASVFWFIAFGAPGVLLVWLMSMAVKQEEVDPFYQRVKQALYWIPVRLMALTLGLMGHFSRCFQVWLEQAKDFDSNDRSLLVACLKSALGEVNEDRMLSETLSLIKRAQLAWLVALALLLIFSIG